MKPLHAMLVVWMVVTACSSDDARSGGGSRAVALQLALKANDPPLQLADGALGGVDAQGSVLEIESARGHVRDIEFDLPEGQSCEDLRGFDFAPNVRCKGDDDDGVVDEDGDDEDKIEVSGPFEVDLVAGTAEPSLEAVTIPAGTYRRVDVRFEPADGGELDDDALDARGRFSSPAQSVPFSLRLHFTEDARFERPGGIELGADGASVALLWLDVSAWFSNVPITECLAEGDLSIAQGTLQIDEDSDCSEIENELKDAIKESGDLD